MKSIIDYFINSSVFLKDQYSKDLSVWKDFLSNMQSASNDKSLRAQLELFFQHNIVFLKYRNESGVVKTLTCTANKKFKELFFAKSKKQIRKILFSKSSKNDLKTKNIKVWNLIDNRPQDFKIQYWKNLVSVPYFFTLREENIVSASESAHDFLD